MLGHPERIPAIIAPLSDSTRGKQDTRVSKKIYIGNLPFTSTEAELQDLFGRHGSVESVNVITDRETGRPRGFAFVEMENASDAADAIRALDGSDLGGRNIKVNEAQDKRSGGGGGGGYGGKRY
ncbi:MAG: RNA-binding protein [Myxococcales bacterium]|nr:RNA-binding protein [Myxococcales bacterium]